MGYKRKNTTLILIITLVSVLGLSIGFAAFSSSLTVKNNATITPDSGNFKVVFSSKSDSLSTTGVSVTKTGNAQAETPTIDNSGNPTIKNLSASFTAPGEKIEYTFYARNAGSYDAYLSSVVFNNINDKSVFKECVASSGTTASMVEEACKGIKVTTTVLSTAYTDTTLNITGHKLNKNASELVKVTIEYTSGSSVADGPFTINFGSIYLTYGSTELTGYPILPMTSDGIYTDGSELTYAYANQILNGTSVITSYQETLPTSVALRFISVAKVTGATYITETLELDYSNVKVNINGTNYKVHMIGTLVTNKAVNKDLMYFSSQDTVAGADVKNSQAIKILGAYSDGIVFTAKISSVPQKAYDREILARSYIGYYDQNNEVKYLYSDITSTTVNTINESLK